MMTPTSGGTLGEVVERGAGEEGEEEGVGRDPLVLRAILPA